VAYAETFDAKSDDYKSNLRLALDAMLDNKSQGIPQINTYLSMVSLYTKLGELDEAKGAAAEAAREFPNDYKPYMYLAFVQIDLETRKENPSDRDFDDAFEWADKARELYANVSLRNPDQNMDLLQRNVLRIQSSIQSGGQYWRSD